METEIHKVKVKDSMLEATYEEYFKEENYSNIIVKKCDQIIHSDLRSVLEKLKLHLVCICEMPEAEQIYIHGIYDYPLNDLNNYVITGYSRGGYEETEGVAIIGQKLLASGMVLNLVTPFTQFEDTDSYQFAGELCADIEACDFEVKEYLFNNKFGFKQLEFDFDSPNEFDVISAENNENQQQKKTRKKKLKVEVADF